MRFAFVLLALFLSDVWGASRMQVEISMDKTLTRFYELLAKSKLALSSLQYRELTVFAPTDEAFEEFDGVFVEDLVLYHLVPLERKLGNLDEGSLDVIKENHPPLWVSKHGDDIYVNDALIIRNLSDQSVRSRNDYFGKNQVLHIIDRVLSPGADTTTSPTAFDFLTQSALWKLQPYTFHTFLKRLGDLRSLNYYRTPRKSTFFISVDQFTDVAMQNQIDKDVLDANVVSYRVVFVRADDEMAYITKGVDRDFYGTVEFLNEGAVRTSKISKRTRRKVGEKIVKILHANIPVRNGVVHVVREPLGLFPRPLTKFPFLPVINKISGDPTLNMTHYLLQKYDLLRLLNSDDRNVTIFAPDDTAWRSLGYNLSQFDSKDFKAEAVMRRHIIPDEYYDLQRLQDASHNFRGREMILDTANERLTVVITNNTIKWGDKIMQITRANYECTNGIIHIISAPFVFDSELKPLQGSYYSLLYKGWSVMKKIMY